MWSLMERSLVVKVHAESGSELYDGLGPSDGRTKMEDQDVCLRQAIDEIKGADHSQPTLRLLPHLSVELPRHESGPSRIRVIKCEGGRSRSPNHIYCHSVIQVVTLLRNRSD